MRGRIRVIMTQTEKSEKKSTPEKTRESLFWLLASQAKSQLIIEALNKVDRRDFAPPDCENVYDDEIVELGDGASISQPALVLEMIEWLAPKGGGKVLEIGTGSGWNAALLACCFDKVYTIEYNPALAESARQKLKEKGFDNAEVVVGDGILGLTEQGPYDAIIVTAGITEIPKNLALQLNPRFGRLVAPAGKDPRDQMLVVLTRIEGEFLIRRARNVNFHLLMSEHKGGWTKEAIEEIEKQKRDFVIKMIEESGWSEEEVNDRITRICGKPFSPNLLAEIYSLEKLRELQQLLGKSQEKA